MKLVAILATLALLTSNACATVRTSRSIDHTDEPPPLLGLLERADLETHDPAWIEELVQAEPDPTEAARLSAATGGDDEVVVYLGTWCADSRREIARLWRALDLLGPAPPFELQYVGLDRSKAEPADLLTGVEIEYVPTIIVRRQGRELGRIIESSPNGIETDLADLLSGAATGPLSGRDEPAEGVEP